MIRRTFLFLIVASVLILTVAFAISQPAQAVGEEECWTGVGEVYTGTVVLLNPTCGWVVEWTKLDEMGWPIYGVLAELPGTKIILRDVVWAQAWRLDAWDAGNTRPYWGNFQQGLARERAELLRIPVALIPINTAPLGALIGDNFCPQSAEEAALMFGGEPSYWERLFQCRWRTNTALRAYIPRGSIGYVRLGSTVGPTFLDLPLGGGISKKTWLFVPLVVR